MRCRPGTCWCSAPWPTLRLIPSTGQRYTVEELPCAEPGVRLFAYVLAMELAEEAR